MTTFESLGTPRAICDVLAARGITEPFPIQSAAIADGLAGRDVCGRAPTGSGKTLAFGVPLVANLPSAAARRPRALVLAPTRELAGQIAEELEPLAAAMGARTLTVFGGVGYGAQRKGLARGVEVLVACPGRLADLISEGSVDLGDVARVVLDEADRMADMGFLPAVERLLDQTASGRQTMLFSATLDGAVDRLVTKYQNDPARHDVTTPDDEPDLVHTLLEVVRTERARTAAEVIGRHGSTIVFCRTRHGADRVARQISKQGVTTAPIHGGRNQNQRQRALDAFVAGDVTALVATDVAARGIHVDDVACVVHYDPPGDAETYVHRSGRSGRAGAQGQVVSLLEGSQLREARKMLRSLGIEPGGEQVPAPARADGGRNGAERGDVKRREAPGARRGRSGSSESGSRGRNRREKAASRPRSTASDDLHSGEIKFFDRRRGFGFIAHPDRGDVFVHHSALPGAGRKLKGGEAVSFEIAPGRKG